MRDTRARLGCLLALCCAGCIAKSPSIVDIPWKSLEVEYCLPSGETKIWRSTDPDELEVLRVSMQPQESQGLTMLLKSYTNELRLRLSSGQAWNLYYRDKPNRITLFDPNNIKQSFVVGISGDLYAELSKRLIAHGGSAIALDGSCRIPKMASM